MKEWEKKCYKIGAALILLGLILTLGSFIFLSGCPK